MLIIRFIMGANVTIYCLENLTDYLEFERLCHDLLSLSGYSGIEPLGGFSDKGRDAIHVNKAKETTIFAYSVREDWRAKLSEDASKISGHGHTCDVLAFVTDAKFSAGARDEAVATIHEKFGWKLDLYGAERLRVLLDAEHPHVKVAHPHIFPPDLLALQNTRNAIKERNYIFISASADDVALATWLTQKLTAEGYLVWYEKFKLLGGENYFADIDKALKNQTFCVVSLYSRASLSNPDLTRQRNLALSISDDRNVDFLIPLRIDDISESQLDYRTRALYFIPFENSWAMGLVQLLAKLNSINCPKLLTNGLKVITNIYSGQDVLSKQTEVLFSNTLSIDNLPENIKLFKPEKEIPSEDYIQLRNDWSYRQKGNLFISFHHPPAKIIEQYSLKTVGSFSWRLKSKIEGIDTHNLVSELIRKALLVKCYAKGMEYCSVSNLYYFPIGLLDNERLNYTRTDGLKTYVKATGKRKFWKPTGSEFYHYHLAPDFYIVQDLYDDFVALIRVRIRLTDNENSPLTGKIVNSRRKHLCRDWWNNDWLNRILAICKFLSDDDGSIRLGESSKEQIVVSAQPFSAISPVSINEDVLGELSHERTQLLAELESIDLDSNEDESE